jgi:hypothetical protein
MIWRRKKALAPKGSRTPKTLARVLVLIPNGLSRLSARYHNELLKDDIFYPFINLLDLYLTIQRRKTYKDVARCAL